MVVTLVEFELYVQHAVNSNFILYIQRSLRLRLSRVENNEFILPRHPIVVAVYGNEDEVADLHDNPIVGLKLFLNTIEAEVVVATLGKHTRWLKVTHKTQELCALSFVKLVLYYAHQLNTNALVFHFRAGLQLHSHLPFHIFIVSENGSFELIAF